MEGDLDQDRLGPLFLNLRDSPSRRKLHQEAADLVTFLRMALSLMARLRGFMEPERVAYQL